MTQSMSMPYSRIVGLPALEGYAMDRAIERWGSAFQGALNRAVEGAKTRQEAEQKAERVLRRWVPSTRKYR